MSTADKLIEENRKRVNTIRAPFNPITGENSVGKRFYAHIDDMYPYDMCLPVSMKNNALLKQIIRAGSIEEFCIKKFGEYTEEIRERVIRRFTKLRCQHDFPFYAYVYNKIKNKEGGKNINFKLSYPQRYLLGILEDMRMKGIPIRVILLKARQWGGSTLVQLYIAWIQLLHKEGWYSAIVAQDASTSRKIKAMYSKMLQELPPWLIDCPDNAKLAFTPYEGSALDSIITYSNGAEKARDTVITIGTYNNPSAGRGGDMSCVHYSEVGFWEDTDGKTPEDIIRTISSSLLLEPLTVEVIESTANGMENFFYKAYQKAKEGKSNRRAVFVPWFMIERYTRKVEDDLEFANWLLTYKDSDNPPPGCLDSGKYYWHLWEIGATFESINWYIEKRKDFIEHADMAAEFPSDDVEAFKNSGNTAFSIYQLDTLKKSCKEPLYVGEVQGDEVKGKNALKNVHFADDHKGLLQIWCKPGKEHVKDRYLVIVDIGGRSKSADYSDILVIDRYWMMYGGKPEVVAEWHGHIDHDLLAWKAAQIAKYYNDALLVIESNTIETKDNDTDGDQSEYIFNQIADCYSNLYMRETDESKVQQDVTGVYGFHTNRKTKPVIIANMQSCIREQAYIERSIEAIGEMSVYMKVGNGKYEAASGCHDDRVMTRAIGLYICYCKMDLPKLIEKKKETIRKQIVNTEATV